MEKLLLTILALLLLNTPYANAECEIKLNENRNLTSMAIKNLQDCTLDILKEVKSALLKDLNISEEMLSRSKGLLNISSVISEIANTKADIALVNTAIISKNRKE